MGKLLDLIILDTRNYDRSITSLEWNDEYITMISDDPSRTLMGSRQENWFYRSLSESKERGATWRIVGNQIIFSRITENYGSGEIISGDNWNVSFKLQYLSFSLSDFCRATSRTETELLSICTTTTLTTMCSSLVTATRTGYV